jgi:diguanylate cyclase (GGDEF)-like protein
MKAATRPLPLRWLYPVIGAAVAAIGAILLSLFHAEPLYMSIAATLLFIGVGWFLGFKEDSLRETASTDALTGVSNRRCFDDRMAQAVADASRQGQPLTLLFVDVDHLKTINDQRGHTAGDASLRLVGESLARTCRSRDLVARWGGDEFVVLAQWTNGREGLILAQRIRETLSRLCMGQGGELPTVSIGVAELQPEAPRPEALLLAADEALYQAKMAGRDRAVLAPATRVVKRRNPPMAKLRTRPLRIADVSSPPVRKNFLLSAGRKGNGRGERI